MSRAKNAIEYMPQYMAEFRQMQELYNGIQPELDLMYNNKDTAMDECFALSCNGFGLERYEKMLGLSPLPSDTVQDRRLRVIAALNGDTPYTFTSVLNKLKVLCGEDNVSMDYYKDYFTLRVMLQLSAKSQYNTVKKMLRQMLPCNISLVCSINFNRHQTLKPFTHEQLKAYTHNNLRQEVL